MILSLVLCMLSMYIAVFMLKEFLAYRKLDFYRKQGIPSFYNPVFGFISYFIPKTGSKDDAEGLKQLYMANKDKDLVVSNMVGFSESTILLLGREIITEFTNKEFKLTSKMPFSKETNAGFIDFGDDDALKKRSIFKAFFSHNSLIDVLPRLHKIISNHFTQFEADHWPQGSDRKAFKTINFSASMDNLFADIVDFFILGEVKANYIDDLRLSKAIATSIGSVLAARQTVLNGLSFGFLDDWKLLPGSIKAHKMVKNLEDKLYNIYLRRQNDTITRRSKNVIDLIIEENTKLPESQKWSKQDIAANINLFQLAGSDTTINTTNTFAHYLSVQPGLQNKLRALVRMFKHKDGEIDILALYNDKKMKSFIKEVMRMFGSALVTTIRRVIKTSRLGKYTIRKGDFVFIPCALKHIDPSLFESPLTFDPDRFSEDNVNKVNNADYAPFGRGNRNCIGQFLSEMILSAIFAEVIRRFEIIEDPDCENKMSHAGLYGIKNCSIKMRPLSTGC